ncbi:MAG: hydrogenase maturation protease [Gordonibacter sp.]|uniref:hydrogenase maturation protease n=1 Tax=Gordonibacter sp. TaxID=1968902 RepID=UPI002FCA62BB
MSAGSGVEDARGGATSVAGETTEDASLCDHAGYPSEGVSAPLPRIAVFCVGNKLMLDDGVGPAVYEELLARYEMPDNVELFDVGCLSFDMLNYVNDYEVIVTVDAVDGTDKEPGTVFRFQPDAMARHVGATASLHDLKLIDLFDAAFLLGYEAEGLCLGMQVENPSPALVTIGLTPKVDAALPLLVETVAGELARFGSPLVPRMQVDTAF